MTEALYHKLYETFECEIQDKIKALSCVEVTMLELNKKNYLLICRDYRLNNEQGRSEIYNIFSTINDLEPIPETMLVLHTFFESLIQKEMNEI